MLADNNIIFGKARLAPHISVFTTYLLSNGKITGNLSCSAGMATTVTDTTGEIEGLFDLNLYYVLNNTATIRPSMAIIVNKTTIAANGSDTANFSNIPQNASVSVDSGTLTSLGTATTEAFAATDVGTYTVDFSCFPYLNQSFQITAQ